MKILELDEAQERLLKDIIKAIDESELKHPIVRVYLQGPSSGKAIVLAMVQEYLDSKIKR